MSPGSTGFQGLQFSENTASQFNAIAFLVQSMLAGIATAALVQVKGVTNNGGVSPSGFVDIQPMVNQVDGDGNAVPHGTIYHCPYFRLQGGANAVILDPQVGDVGIAVFASRDISSATAARAVANPGSARTFDYADGLYIGGVLNGAPTQYVQFSEDGITVSSPAAVTINAPDVTVNCTNGSIIASTLAKVQAPSILLQNAGAALKKLVNSAFITFFNNHVHTGPGGNTGAPTVAAGTAQETSVVQAE